MVFKFPRKIRYLRENCRNLFTVLQVNFVQFGEKPAKIEKFSRVNEFPHVQLTSLNSFLIPKLTSNAGTTVERSIGVDTHRILDAAAIFVLALVDVVADLALARGKVQTHAREAGAT
jgi:hypothetical protein